MQYFNTAAKELLRILYFLRAVRKDDLHTYGRMRYSDRAVSNAYRKLLRDGDVTEQRIPAHHRSGIREDRASDGYLIAEITPEGITHLCRTAERDPYYRKHRSDFAGEAAYCFSPYQYHRYRKTLGKFYALNRIKLLLLASGAHVMPDDKPKLDELYANTLLSEEDDDYNQYNLGIYKDFGYRDCQRILEEGVFYTMGEIREFVNSRQFDGADQISATRIAGVFANRHTCFAVYAPTAETNRMIKVNGVAERAAVALITRVFRQISDFEREIGCCGMDRGGLDALVITNGASLIPTMVMGHHPGVMPKNEPDMDPDYESPDVSDAPVYVLKFPSALTETQAEHLEREISGLSPVESVRASAGHRSCRIRFVREARRFPKEEIRGIAEACGLQGITLSKDDYDIRMITCGYPRHRRIFAVNADLAGAEALRYLITHTPEQYRQDRNALIASDPYFGFREKDPMDLYAGSFRTSMHLMNREGEYSLLVPVIYMPVPELRLLHRMADDFDRPAAAVITLPGLERIIAQSVRKDILFYRILPDGKPVRTEGIPGYDRAGCEYGRQRIRKAPEEKVKRKRKHRTTVDLDMDLWKELSAKAGSAGMPVGRYIEEIIKKGICR